MIEVVGLVVVLCACALARLLDALLRALRIDPAEAMLWLGLAEQEPEPATASGRPHGRRRR